MKLISKYLLLASIPFAGVIAFPNPAVAQSGGANNLPTLQNALRRIARNSNDSSALADAGLAALRLGDTRAAIGFLAKANQIYPKSGRVKVGLARALLKEQNPFGALRYFDEAVANGVSLRDIAADRGLAYDLIGRNTDAQKDYQLALQFDKSDQLLSRYAISLGISGDIEGSDAQLYTLLNKSDRAAWRSKAFILAMNGKEKDANKIARQTMQKKMARAMKPFFDRMPKLTAAQKAAAVHFGHFPANENIGVDVASVRYASNSAVRKDAGADAGLIPLGKPLGEDVKKPRILAMPDTSKRRRPGALNQASRKKLSGSTQLEILKNQQSLPAPTDGKIVETSSSKPVSPSGKNVSPGFETKLGVASAAEKSSNTATNPSLASSPLKKQPELVSATVNRKVAIGGFAPKKNPVRKPESSPIDKPAIVNPPTPLINFDLAKAGASSIPPSAGTLPGDRKLLSDIMGSIEIPDAEKKPAVVPVDLSKITPAKKKASEEPKPEKVQPKKAEPKHPKRYWVQIATGSNLAALKFDYRRMARKQPELFAETSGWTSPWGRTRRLVVGPFESMKSAKLFESGFRKGGGDGFAWVSANGVTVNKLNKK